MQRVAEEIPGYTYGTSEVAVSRLSMRDLDELKISAGFTENDERYLRLAGEVLFGQTKALIDHWRHRIIAGVPNLARHTRGLDGGAIPEYSAASGLRFQQWILDTCLRRYDQDWINYQQEIALRHTSLKKNRVDGVRSTSYVPLRDVVAFVAVMNHTIKSYLAAKGHSVEEVEQMHRAWCASLHMQIALWVKMYADCGRASDEW